MNRTRFLKLIVQGMGAVAAAVALVPSLLAALTPARRRRTTQWQPVGRLESFPLDQIQRASVEVPRDDWSAALREKGVYVWRVSADEVVVFSRNCTDLSCPITWDAPSGCFYCPCHGGIFAKNGDRMAGPPKRPLYRYANRIRHGVVEIDLQSLPAMA